MLMHVAGKMNGVQLFEYRDDVMVREDGNSSLSPRRKSLIQIARLEVLTGCVQLRGHLYSLV